MFCGKLFVYQKVPKLTGTSQVAGPTWMLENVADQRQQRLMATGVVLCLDQLLSLLCFGNFLRELILKTIEHLNSPCVFDIMNPSLEILSHLLDPNSSSWTAKRSARPIRESADWRQNTTVGPLNPTLEGTLPCFEGKSRGIQGSTVMAIYQL